MDAGTKWCQGKVGFGLELVLVIGGYGNTGVVYACEATGRPIMDAGTKWCQGKVGCGLTPGPVKGVYGNTGVI